MIWFIVAVGRILAPEAFLFMIFRIILQLIFTIPRPLFCSDRWCSEVVAGVGLTARKPDVHYWTGSESKIVYAQFGWD